MRAILSYPLISSLRIHEKLDVNFRWLLFRMLAVEGRCFLLDAILYSKKPSWPMYFPSTLFRENDKISEENLLLTQYAYA